jgi:hypothetical protein
VTTDASGHTINRVAGLKRRRMSACRHHDARHVHAEDGWQRLARVIGGSGKDFRIERIDPARHDAHQHVA